MSASPSTCLVLLADAVVDPLAGRVVPQHRLYGLEATVGQVPEVCRPAHVAFCNDVMCVIGVMGVVGVVGVMHICTHKYEGTSTMTQAHLPLS